jgi:dTMP kinase
MNEQNTRGHFITFEGGEGSGKSTQIKLLSKALADAGQNALVTREPGGSPMGERIRALLLDPDVRMDPMTQLFLFNAARRDHVCDLIEPALEQGKWVLCDRFADSSRAYQGAAGLIPAQTIQFLEKLAVGITRPDLTIILDISPRIGLERARRRRSRGTNADGFEAADLIFHEKVRAGFKEIAKNEPTRCKIIDANKSRDELHREIWALCESHFNSASTDSTK